MTFSRRDSAVNANWWVSELWNTGDVPLQLLCCCAPAYSDDDTVITE